MVGILSQKKKILIFEIIGKKLTLLTVIDVLNFNLVISFYKIIKFWWWILMLYYVVLYYHICAGKFNYKKEICIL